MGSLGTNFQMPNPSNDKTPSHLVNSCLFGNFLCIFLATVWARSTIRQHLLTKISESGTHTLKSLNLKYYHHTTPRSVNFRFSKVLVTKSPFSNKGVQMPITSIKSFKGEQHSPLNMMWLPHPIFFLLLRARDNFHTGCRNNSISPSSHPCRFLKFA